MTNTSALRRSQHSYSQLRTKWLSALGGNHPNAIWLQMAHMVRDEVWFKTIIRLREVGGHPPINSYIWDLFITGYGIKQTLAIRRLTDSGKTTGSLLRLVREIRKNKHLLKRDVMVGHDGTGMDVDQLHRQLVESVSFTDDDDAGHGDPLALQRWSDADFAHTAFDRLRAAQLNAPRKPNDKVDDTVIQNLERALTSDAIKRVRARCNHYLAHADLREFVSNVEGPTYNDIHWSIASLVQVRQFLRGDFLNHSSGPVVATPQGSHMSELANPLVPELPDSEYRKAWSESADEVEAWANIDEVRKFAVHPVA